MKLVTAKISPFAARCRMLIYAKDLDVEFLEYPVDITLEEFRKINPIGKMPILINEDLVIPESDTICMYLEESFPDPAMMPSAPSERAQMRLLSRIADLYVMAPLTPLFAHLSRKRRDQDVVDQGITAICKGLQALEANLGHGDFAVGEQLSIADCSLVPILYFLNVYMPFFDIEEPFSDYSRLQNYSNNITRNNHAERIIKEIQQGIEQKSKR
ncbi:MAG: glutathione S-transferase family protein [Pseudomonadales bacterium]